MALVYVHDNGKLNQPKGFIPNTTEHLFAEAEGWEKRSEVFKELQSGHHR